MESCLNSKEKQNKCLFRSISQLTRSDKSVERRKKYDCVCNMYWTLAVWSQSESFGQHKWNAIDMTKRIKHASFEVRGVPLVIYPMKMLLRFNGAKWRIILSISFYRLYYHCRQIIIVNIRLLSPSPLPIMIWTIMNKKNWVIIEEKEDKTLRLKVK